MRGLHRFAASLLVCVACFLAFPLSLGEGGALELTERRPADRAAAWRMDAEVRLFGVGADPDVDPLLVYVAQYSPRVYRWFVLMSLFAPGVLFFVGSSVAESVLRVFFGRLLDWHFAGRLPAWPLKRTDKGPSLVIGEVHHRTELREVPRPWWLRMPEKGLFTGLIIFGAIGTGKTTSCMRPFCRQLLEWQADDPEKRVAALVLEVKGDFCYDVQEMLAEYGRIDDYMELSLPPEPGDDDYGKREVWQWNPLFCPWVDTYSLAYSLSSIVNQLFGAGKDPFWQQAYTNVIQWILAAYRSLPGGWVTFEDVYNCMLSKKALSDLIDRHAEHVYGQFEYEVFVGPDDFEEYQDRLTSVTLTEEDVVAYRALEGTPVVGALNENDRHALLPEQFVLGPLVDGKRSARTHEFEWQEYKGAVVTRVGYGGYCALCWELRKEGQVVDFRAHSATAPEADDVVLHEKIDQWYKDDWLGLDEKLRSSIVEGMSVFLSVFVQPRVARVFCPKNPAQMTDAEKKRLIPPLLETIESGKVLALNMPGGTNPALARAAGVMLKSAWLSTLLLRPKAMKLNPGKFFRPAVFVCDEYQSFVTTGEKDPAGDEKAFALTRQSRCVPIVATQSISSLRSVLGDGEAWRALLQTLRSRIFLSLADDASLETASKLLGQVNRMRASYSLSENTARAAASMFTGRIGGGSASAGLSKSYAEKREALFHPRDIALLGTCQAIAQIFDGNEVHEATRVYLKPDYKPRDLPYWRWYEEMQRDKIA